MKETKVMEFVKEKQEESIVVEESTNVVEKTITEKMCEELETMSDDVEEDVEVALQQPQQSKFKAMIAWIKGCIGKIRKLKRPKILVGIDVFNLICGTGLIVCSVMFIYFLLSFALEASDMTVIDLIQQLSGRGVDIE